MKSKLNDAELIAEAYAKVEVQEEGLGALARSVGGGIAAAGRGIKKVATSDTTKKIVKGAGNLAKDVAKEAGAVAAEVGGEAIKTAGKAAVSLGDKAMDGVDRGISKLAGAEDGEQAGIEDAEHAAPEEVDMSQNPSPESLEVSKEVETPCDKIAAPSIQPSIPTPSVNHHDDSEVKMALAELYKIEKYAFALGLMMKETNALEGWTAAKITKAADYLGSVFHKLDYDMHSEAEDHADIAPEDHESH